MLMQDAIIARIEELKKEKNLSQYMLSVLSTVPQTTLISIKRKRSNAVSAKIVYLLCEGFNITLAEFYDSPLFARSNLEMA